MMMPYRLCILFMFFGLICSAQVKIGDTIDTIHENSLLELESTSKVLVLSRMNTSQMSAINPLRGGLLYNTDNDSIYVFNGNAWRNVTNTLAQSGTFSFIDNNNGSFTINYSDGTSFTSQDLTGPKGDAGTNGINGTQGPKGDKGYAGTNGIDGTQGPKGDKGDAGANGIDGAQGPKGDPGDDGTNGINGAQGPKGDKGDAGTNGINGAQGPKGDKGDAGTNGIDGAQGPKGDKGDAGTNGINGAQGPKGDPGDPATDDQEISTNNNPGQISISGGNSITLNVDDDDNSISNEIQNLSLTGNNLSISGTGGNTITLPNFSGTVGSVLFANSDGTITQNNTQLFWNNTNTNLGVGTNTPQSSLDVSGSLATSIIKTSANLSLNQNHHTIILGGDHTITLPSTSNSLGRMYIIKNPTNNQISISNYLDETGSPASTISENTIIWLQSDGADWQLINNISNSSNSSSGGTAGDTGGGTGGSGGPMGVLTTDITSDYIDDGQNGSSNNFQIQVRNTTGTIFNSFEVLIDDAPYATIPGLILTNYTYEVIDNGDATYDHIFTSIAPLGAYESRHINGGSGISPPGSGASCACVSFYEL